MPYFIQHGNNRKNYIDVLKLLKEETPRGKAIVGHSILEVSIDKILEKRMINSKDDIKSLGFKKKIKLSYSTGAISKEEYEELKVINEIRNKAAHYYEYFSFESKFINDLLSKLKISENLSIALKEEAGFDWRYERADLSQKFSSSIAVMKLILGLRIKGCKKIESCPSPIKN
jgi:hypothetical protein